MLKSCTKCKEEKEVGEFHKDKTRLGGLYPSCKVCRKKVFDAYYENHKETRRAHNKLRDKERKNQGICTRCPSFAMKGKTLCVTCNEAISKKYFQHKKEGICVGCPEKARPGRVLCSFCQKKYTARNSKRKEVDHNFKIACNLRARLHRALKNNQKVGSAVRDLGCSIPEFKEHIEKQFQDGMTWENHGIHTWHLDHIKPLSSFDLTDRSQLLEAVHYTNIQPLWAKENLRKGGYFGRR